MGTVAGVSEWGIIHAALSVSNSTGIVQPAASKKPLAISPKQPLPGSQGLVRELIIGLLIPPKPQAMMKKKNLCQYQNLFLIGLLLSRR